MAASRYRTRAPGRSGFSSSHTWAHSCCSQLQSPGPIVGVPRPTCSAACRIKATSLALAEGFSTTEPPRKPPIYFLFKNLTCLLRNLHAGQEAAVTTGQRTTDWFQMGKEVRQGCVLLPCLFNFYAEYIMRNAGLAETQAGIKIAGRNINNLRYADDTTLMAESEQELKTSR